MSLVVKIYNRTYQCSWFLGTHYLSFQAIRCYCNISPLPINNSFIVKEKLHVLFSTWFQFKYRGQSINLHKVEIINPHRYILFKRKKMLWSTSNMRENTDFLQIIFFYIFLCNYSYNNWNFTWLKTFFLSNNWNFGK